MTASVDDYISVRDWRRKPPLRLRPTTKLGICWCWIKCTRCPHMSAVAIAPYVDPLGPDGWRPCCRRPHYERASGGQEARHFGDPRIGAAMPCHHLPYCPRGALFCARPAEKAVVDAGLLHSRRATTLGIVAD